METVWAAGPPPPAPLLEVLEESRHRGLIGRVDIGDQVMHAAGFAAWLDEGSRVVDLGSGGGLPGLALAVGRQDLEVTLLDSAARRVRFLEWAVEFLDLAETVRVVHARAEDAGRMDHLRSGFDAVVARSFGIPAVTAECGRAFLSESGKMVVSEPPPSPGANVPRDRWPTEGLAGLGLVPERVSAEGFGYVLLRTTGPCAPEVPRRAGIPTKRPLF
ncbi:MAG: RsmG family class I SAM-dependent methyltransferase [Acidimicrobiia bacterium]